MTAESDRWYDDAAGPVVRPYAMTRGRTSHAAEAKLDLIALVVAAPGGAGDGGTGPADPEDDGSLSPEQVEIVRLCHQQPASIAEIAAEVDLPVGVVRVLVGDLLDAGHVTVRPPVPPAELPDESILRDVINGLRAL
ncbi:DUF742 domain-containing protein [Streptomyces sp. NRRL F-5123]|uniref:DUF742 domain-containing protein n=1 Tax=Streptomyces sp. NRRL F-5123 TaxID=1463856 RepID=UPI0004E210C3|nr:DUF742 domain-containing protein [Streptomyces sp. NRRL F-5123]